MLMRDTYAIKDNFVYRLRATAALLNVSENTLRTYLQQSGIAIRRQNTENPSAPAIRLFDIDTVFKIAEWRRAQGLVRAVSPYPIIICTELIKGGVAKTTTTAEIGTQLQLAGYRVLMIDLDVQANLTQLMGYESDFSLDEAKPNGLSPVAIIDGTFSTIVRNYLANKTGRKEPLADVSNCIKYPFGSAGPALIPSDTFLGELEHYIATVTAVGDKDHIFREFFKASSEGKIPGLNVSDFDFIIFDCPPSIGQVSTNAVAAADYIVAPVKMDTFGVKGMSRLVAEINGLNERANYIQPELVILPTHYSTNISRVARMQNVLQGYKGNLAPMSISASELFPKSQENYLPLTLQQPTSAPVAEYRVFTEYLLKKFSGKHVSASANASASASASPQA